MKIEFKPKERLVAVGLRVTEDEIRELKEFAQRNQASLTAAATALFRAALKELTVPARSKSK